MARLLPLEPPAPEKRVLGAGGAGVWIAPGFDTGIPPGWEDLYQLPKTIDARVP